MASTLSHDPQPRNFNFLENGGHARRTGRGRRSPWSRLALGTALIAMSASGCVGDNRSVTEPDLVLPVFSHGGDEGGPHGTHMSGANETPPRPSRAQGQLVLRLEDGGTLTFKLLAANIEDVTQAHIHLAPPGVPGPVIAWLYPAAPPAVHIPGHFDGVLAAGVITDADVMGPLAGQGVASLVEAIRAGNAYANIHTILYPPGEIRGQVR